MAKIVSVLVECDGRTYRVIDNLSSLLRDERDRCVCEQRVGRRVVDLVKTLENES